jgi:hypothetical protein
LTDQRQKAEEIAMLPEEGDLTMFVAERDMSSDELFDELLRSYSHSPEGAPSHLELWDLSRASFADISGREIHELGQRIAAAGKGRRPSGRAAFVSGRGVEYGMAQVLATRLSIEGYAAAIAVFTDVDSARAWLRGGNRS